MASIPPKIDKIVNIMRMSNHPDEAAEFTNTNAINTRMVVATMLMVTGTIKELAILMSFFMYNLLAHTSRVVSIAATIYTTAPRAINVVPNWLGGDAASILAPTPASTEVMRNKMLARNALHFACLSLPVVC